MSIRALIGENNGLVVKFATDYEPSGTTSQIGWSNRDLMPALRQMFHCSPRERITGIEIGADGITARLATEGS